MTTSVSYLTDSVGTSARLGVVISPPLRTKIARAVASILVEPVSSDIPSA